MNKKLEALNTDEIVDVSGGFHAPVYEDIGGGKRKISRWEVFYDEDGDGHQAGDHAGFAKNIRNAMQLDRKINPNTCPPRPPLGRFGPHPGHHGPGPRRGRRGGAGRSRP